MESRDGGRPAPSLLLVAVVGLLVLVVALASRPDAAPFQPRLGDDPERVVLDTVFYLLLVAGLLGLLVAVWALWPDPEAERPRLDRPRRPSILGGTTALMALALVLLHARLRGLPATQVPALGGGAAAPPLPRPGGQPLGGGTDWPALLITLAVVAAAAALAWWWLRPWATPSSSRRRPARQLAAVLDDAIEDVLREQDPRRAVIAAWARLERVLAAHGLPRQPAQAPFEYAKLAVVEVGLTAAAVEGLAGLFEWARFSVNEVTPGMREEALGALVAIRDQIRLAA